MRDIVYEQALSLETDEAVRGMLEEVCRVSGMGFAAVARVTEDRWIACQVLDQIEFGLTAGGELKVGTTICDDIRKTCNMVVIDNAAEEPEWRTHPTPIMYGFKSYISLPITLADGTFFGTLCAIDPKPRELKGTQLLQVMKQYTARIAQVIEQGTSGTR
jgi:GAF domain-containing protein